MFLTEWWSNFRFPSFSMDTLQIHSNERIIHTSFFFIMYWFWKKYDSMTLEYRNAKTPDPFYYFNDLLPIPSDSTTAYNRSAIVIGLPPGVSGLLGFVYSCRRSA